MRSGNTTRSQQTATVIIAVDRLRSIVLVSSVRVGVAIGGVVRGSMVMYGSVFRFVDMRLILGTVAGDFRRQFIRINKGC